MPECVEYTPLSKHRLKVQGSHPLHTRVRAYFLAPVSAKKRRKKAVAESGNYWLPIVAVEVCTKRSVDADCMLFPIPVIPTKSRIRQLGKYAVFSGQVTVKKWNGAGPIPKGARGQKLFIQKSPCECLSRCCKIKGLD